MLPGETIVAEQVGMWFEDLPDGASWAQPWSGYIRCRGCGGIRRIEGVRPSCGQPMPPSERLTVRMADGKEVEVAEAFMGAEGRYEDWIYLIMLEREWLRPLTDADRFLGIAEGKRPSPRAVFALVFWTYFETRIEHLFREALKDVPAPIANDLLRRHGSIGSRLDQLYRIVFAGTYSGDLKELNFSSLAALLDRVQTRRNDFVHGKPEAIDDELVRELAGALKDEHESWIAVFNRRATLSIPR